MIRLRGDCERVSFNVVPLLETLLCATTTLTLLVKTVHASIDPALLIPLHDGGTGAHSHMLALDFDCLADGFLLL